jgi:hypothetical protein
MYAICELCVGDADTAVSLLDDFLKTDPSFSLAVLAVTAAAFCAGKKEKGLASVEKVKKLPFNLAQYFTGIAKMLIPARRYEYARRLLKAAVETGNTTDETNTLLEEARKG